MTIAQNNAMLIAPQAQNEINRQIEAQDAVLVPDWDVSCRHGLYSDSRYSEMAIRDFRFPPRPMVHPPECSSALRLVARRISGVRWIALVPLGSGWLIGSCADHNGETWFSSGAHIRQGATI